MVIVEEGDVVLEKRSVVRLKRPYEKVTKRQQIELMVIGQGGLLGEESLNGEPYCFSCKIHSLKALVLIINVKDIKLRFPNDMKSHIIEAFHEKQKFRQSLLSQRIEEQSQILTSKYEEN